MRSAFIGRMPPRPLGTEVPDPEVIAAFDLACRDAGADRRERQALFRAAVVAAGLRAEPPRTVGGRVGPLAQDETWGAAAARRNPYVAASVFLKEARRLRGSAGRPLTAAGLAARVQGRRCWWRYLAAAPKAHAALAALPDRDHAPDTRTSGAGPLPARTAAAGRA